YFFIHTPFLLCFPLVTTQLLCGYAPLFHSLRHFMDMDRTLLTRFSIAGYDVHRRPQFLDLPRPMPKPAGALSVRLHTSPPTPPSDPYIAAGHLSSFLPVHAHPRFSAPWMPRRVSSPPACASRVGACYMTIHFARPPRRK
ncbi:hypothetical protein HYPSUDRAFT_1074391, partial [Hypholoma sublateritium FD-334 SS-4]